MRKLVLLFISCMLAACDSKNVESPVITSIKLDRKYLYIQEGDNYEFKVTHTPSELDAPQYKWSVDDAKIASIDQNGVLTARSAGTTKINVATIDNRLNVSCDVSVHPIQVSSIKLNKNTLDLKIDQFEILTCTISPDNAADKTTVWKSENPYIAEVDDTGKVTAKHIGTTIITATIGKVNDKCNVTVSPIKVTGISFYTRTTKVRMDETIKLYTDIVPKNATNQSLLWKSADSNIASVDGDGVVRGNNIGETVITATTVDGGFSAKCNIIVLDGVVRSISFDETSLSMAIGEERTINATITPTTAADKSLEWSSTNPNVATVDENGTVTGKTSGTTIIKATTVNGLTATCDITVASIDRLLIAEARVESLAIGTDIVDVNMHCRITNPTKYPVTINNVTLCETYTPFESNTPGAIINGDSYYYAFKTIRFQNYDGNITNFMKYRVGLFNVVYQISAGGRDFTIYALLDTEKIGGFDIKK